MDSFPDIDRCPGYGLTLDSEFNIDTAKFGDGYEQRRPAGLNSVRRVWSLSWEYLTEQQTNTVKDFLLSRKGVYAFFWNTPNTDEVVRVVCKEPPSIEYSEYGRYNVKATFREDFAP